MTREEAIKEAETQLDVYESMILYNKDFEPTNDNSNYEKKVDFLKIAIEALEKQIPQTPDYEGDGYWDGELVYDTWICPCCGKDYEVDYDNYKFCPDCGQRINWEDDDGTESKEE